MLKLLIVCATNNQRKGRQTGVHAVENAVGTASFFERWAGTLGTTSDSLVLLSGFVLSIS